MSAFNGRYEQLKRAHYLIARANYRQTCVDLRDEILQASWHEQNQFLHLTGVGVTGIISWEHWKDREKWRELRQVAHEGVNSMADELGLPRSKANTTVKPSGCRPWDGLVTTDKGILTLQELFQDHQEESDWSDFLADVKVLQTERTATNPISKTFNNGVAEVYSVELTYGITLESTAEHKWMVQQHYQRDKSPFLTEVNQWRETRDIYPGDIIDIKLEVYNSNEPAKLLSLSSFAFKMRGDANIISQPEYLNSDLCWLLGYLWGDGTMSPGGYRLRWIDANEEHLEKCSIILKEQFGLESKIHDASGNRKAKVLEVGSSHLWHWLIKNEVFKYLSEKIDLIPKVVRSSTKEHIIAFIAGMIDADANVSISYPKNQLPCKKVIFAQADRRFAKHFQDVALSVGLLFGRSLNSKGQNWQQKKEVYLMTLASFTLPESGDILRRYSCKMQQLDKNLEVQWLWDSSKAKNRPILGRVKNVSRLGLDQTFDIEVSKDHWYYAGAVKSHNSLSKLMSVKHSVPEGVHKPLAKYIFNNINFSVHDPLVKLLQDANYYTFPNPYDNTGVLVRLPVSYDLVEFDEIERDGEILYVNLESAVDQLERYKLLMEEYVDHNCSITVSYSPEEVPSIIDWLDKNWDSYVGVSFIYRNDPTKTAEDLGYPYLPQEVVTKSAFDEYVSQLLPVDLDAGMSVLELEDQECAGGACPVR